MQFSKAGAGPLRQNSNATTRPQYLVFGVSVVKIETLQSTENVIETGSKDSLGTVLGTYKNDTICRQYVIFWT